MRDVEEASENAQVLSPAPSSTWEENNELRTMERMLAEGESPDSKTSGNKPGEGAWPWLVVVARIGHLDALKLLLRYGAELDQTNSLGVTALMAAAGNGKASCAEALLDWGADKDAVDSEGSTALHWAAAAGSLECARLLVHAAADGTKRNEMGKTALDTAQSYGHSEVAALLADEESRR